MACKWEAFTRYEPRRKDFLDDFFREFKAKIELYGKD